MFQNLERLGNHKHSVDLGNTEPVQNIRHQSLETHVLDAGNVLCTFEVLACTIGTTFSCVVYQIFGNLFLSVCWSVEWLLRECLPLREPCPPCGNI